MGWCCPVTSYFHIFLILKSLYQDDITFPLLHPHSAWKFSLYLSKSILSRSELWIGYVDILVHIHIFMHTQTHKLIVVFPFLEGSCVGDHLGIAAIGSERLDRGTTIPGPRPLMDNTFRPRPNPIMNGSKLGIYYSSAIENYNTVRQL